MKIKSLRIQNFRSFEDETIHFDNYTSLIGANGAGKSTVLAALNIFFKSRVAQRMSLLFLQRIFTKEI